MPTEKSGDRDEFIQQNHIATILPNFKEKKKIHPMWDTVNIADKDFVEESKGNQLNKTGMEDIDEKCNQSCQEGILDS